MHLVAPGGRLGNTGRSFAVLGFVESLSETLAGFLHLLLDLLVLLGEPVFDQHVGTVTLLRVLVVDQRVVERADMSRSLPRTGVHEDRGVDAHDILMQLDHRIPPVALDVVFQLHAVLSVVVHRSQTVVDFARREYESVFLAVGDQLFEEFFLCHRIWFLNYFPNYKSTK